ncbi:MarR family winged helix-turn-helix transcriptional regulator (plasmid) [Marinovum sp. KMM 9989]
MAEPEIVTERNRSIQAESYAPYYLSIINSSLAWGASRLYLHLFDVGLNEWRIMSALRNEPGIRAQRIGEIVAMNKSVVSRSTRRIEQDGFGVERLVEGRRLWWLTPNGAEMHDRIIKLALAREEALLHGFNDFERAQLYGFLDRMKGNLKRVDTFDRGWMGNAED